MTTQRILAQTSNEEDYEIIKKKQLSYQKTTASVVKRYQVNGQVKTVQADLSVEKVTSSTTSYIEAL